MYLELGHGLPPFLDEFLAGPAEPESVLLVELHRVFLQVLLHVLQLVLGQKGRRPVRDKY